MQTVFITSCLLLALTFASSKGDKWDEFTVNFKPREYLTWRSGHRDPMPLTVAEAEMKGWSLLDDSCRVPDGPWRGRRYALAGDHALVLLYDVNGHLAGVQSSVPTSAKTNFPSNKQKPPFISDAATNKQTVTAYFVSPGRICNTASARRDEEIASSGFGQGLWIQRTRVPEEAQRVPIEEEALLGSDPKWRKGKCFYAMGQHYWYDLREATACDEFLPVFLLYHKGRLDGFGWAFLADYSSKRFEHPNYDVAKYFMRERPLCLQAAGRLSTTHFWFTSNPNYILPKQTCMKESFKTMFGSVFG